MTVQGERLLGTSVQGPRTREETTGHAIRIEKCRRRRRIVNIRLLACTDTPMYAVQRLLVEQFVQHQARARVQNLICCGSIRLICSALRGLVHLALPSHDVVLHCPAELFHSLLIPTGRTDPCLCLRIHICRWLEYFHECLLLCDYGLLLRRRAVWSLACYLSLQCDTASVLCMSMCQPTRGTPKKCCAWAFASRHFRM